MYSGNIMEHSGHLNVGVAVLQHRTAKALPVAMFRIHSDCLLIHHRYQ